MIELIYLLGIAAILLAAYLSCRPNRLERKIAELVKLCGCVPYVEYYPHTNCDMYKIDNPYTQYGKETIVLHSASEPYERSVLLALREIERRKVAFHGRNLSTI